MGFIGTFVTIVFGRIIPLLVILLAVFVGWLNQAVIPEGKLFATMIPLLKGKLPPTIIGHGKMTGTPPVPDDMMPQPRPLQESFLELPGGHPMPQNGIGMCCRYSAYDDVLVERTILWYLLLGGRLIDTAHVYRNHVAIGKGIQEAIRRGVPRHEIFVTTKLYPSHYGYNTTLEIVPTLIQEELGLDYVDLILMHAPARLPGMNYISQECNKYKRSKKECRQETFQALSELRQQGIVRNVGVSNFVVDLLKELQELDNGVVAPIANNQIQFNPWLTPEWIDTVEYCMQHGITITGYYNLGGTFQHDQATKVETLNRLAQKYDKSVAQIMLRWAMQMGTAIIPGTGNPKHMKENLNVYDFELSSEDVNAINALRGSKEMEQFFVMSYKG